MVSKEAAVQVHFRVTKNNRADYLALKMPYSTGLISFVIIWVTERDDISSHSLVTILVLQVIPCHNDCSLRVEQISLFSTSPVETHEIIISVFRILFCNFRTLSSAVC